VGWGVKKRGGCKEERFSTSIRKLRGEKKDLFLILPSATIEKVEKRNLKEARTV